MPKIYQTLCIPSRVMFVNPLLHSTQVCPPWPWRSSCTTLQLCTHQALCKSGRTMLLTLCTFSIPAHVQLMHDLAMVHAPGIMQVRQNYALDPLHLFYACSCAAHARLLMLHFYACSCAAHARPCHGACTWDRAAAAKGPQPAPCARILLSSR